MRGKFFQIVAAAALCGCGDSTSEPTVDDQLNEVRQATQAFTAIATAQAAGYSVWSPDPAGSSATCATNPAGKMGYHLVNGSLRGSPANPAQADAVIDYRQPEMLLYEKIAEGQMRLVGVEYLVFKEAWERVNGANAAPPTVFGQPLPLSVHTFTSGGPEIPHYELHVWLHSDNSNGMFSPWHPTILC